MAGIDGQPGASFRNFTRGETLSFTFSFKVDGVAVDVTGWKIYIAFTSTLDCQDATAPDLEVVLLPTDAAGGIISGEVTDDETFALPKGEYYARAKYIKADDRAYMIDKARISVYACVNPRRAQ